MLFQLLWEPQWVSLRLVSICHDCHAWSEKAKRQMLDKQMKKAQSAKEAKSPEQDYHDSLYHLEGGGYGFPAVAFKAAGGRQLS